MTDIGKDKKELVDLSHPDYSQADCPDDVVGRTRETFRLPVLEGHEIRVVVDGESFPLLDMGSRGIGIQLTDPDRFVRGERLAHVVILIGDDKFAMKGKVVHVTKEKDLVVCGIALKGMDEETETRLQSFLQQHRKLYFVPAR